MKKTLNRHAPTFSRRQFLLRQPHGKVLFAGEHLADWQGFMEGAVNTGEEAAKLIAGNRTRDLRRAA